MRNIILYTNHDHNPQPISPPSRPDSPNIAPTLRELSEKAISLAGHATMLHLAQSDLKERLSQSRKESHR